MAMRSTEQRLQRILLQPRSKPREDNAAIDMGDTPVAHNN